MPIHVCKNYPFHQEMVLIDTSWIQDGICPYCGEDMKMSDDKRNGSPQFYKLLDQAAEIHNKKSHDYASNDNPYGNYHFAGMLSKLFDNPNDAGFISRIGEKLFRLANLENSGKTAANESVEDTELDIITITTLWVASRRDRRNNPPIDELCKKTLAMGTIIPTNDLNTTKQKIEIKSAGNYPCQKCTRIIDNKDDYISHSIAMHSAKYNITQQTLNFPDKTIELVL